MSYSRLAYKQKDYARKVELALARGEGQINVAPYKPWISVRFSSIGFSTRLLDPAMLHVIHLLSLAEADWARSLIWLPGHAGLYSQVALPRQSTLRLAKQHRVRHPLYPDGKTPVVMTTDLVHVREVDGRRRLFAYSVKSQPDLSKRDYEKLELEKQYWEEQDVPWSLLFRTDVCDARIENARWIENYVPSSPLIPGRDRWREIEGVLYPLVCSGLPLNKACHSIDAALSLQEGVALAQVRFYLASRIWLVDMERLINPFEPISVLDRNLEAI